MRGPFHSPEGSNLIMPNVYFVWGDILNMSEKNGWRISAKIYNYKSQKSFQTVPFAKKGLTKHFTVTGAVSKRPGSESY